MRVPERRLSGHGLAGLVAGALGLLAVATVASRAHVFGESPPPVPATASRLVLDSLFYLVVVLETLVLAAVVWALWPDDGGHPRFKRRSLWQTLTAPLATILLVGMVLLLRDRIREAAGGLRQPPGQGQLRAGPLAAPGSEAINSHAGFDWIAFAVVATVVLGAVALIAYRHSRRRRRALDHRRRLAAGLEQVMSEGLEDLAIEPDPRRAVIAAYARMERVLAAGGVPRHHAEAPLEYVNRVLQEMNLSEELVGGLTELYLTARFSTRDVDAGMRDRALDLLERIRGELRLRAAESQAAAALEPARA